MLNQEFLAAYFVDALAPAERAQVEMELAADHASQRVLANQQLMDQALRVALSGPDADERVKQSVLAVVRASSIEQLRAQVLAETSGRWSVEASERQSVPASERQSVPASERQSVPASERRGVREWSDFLNWAAATLQRCNAATLLRAHAAKLKRVVAVTALMALGVGSYIYVSARFIARTEIGQFTAVVGSPTVRHVGQRSTLNAQRSSPICLGDHIETGDADRAEIQFRDGTTLRLHFNTILEIPNPKSESSNRQLATGNRQSAAPRPDARTLQRFNASTLQRPPEINLLRGQVWTKVQKTTNAPQYAVRTPVATAVARGTEFGLKVQKADKSTLGTQNSKLETNLMAVLTVKEGAVDFFNSFGKIQATAMTESTARADARPTEPKRLQTLQAVRLADSGEWAITTSPLTWPEAAEKLALGGGWAGLRVRDFPSGTPPPNVIIGAATREVRIVQVSRPSPADSAGLQTGDVLLAINGQPVTAASQIEKAILIRLNAETTLNLRRRGEERTAALIVTNRASILPGPTLTPALRARLSEATRQFVEDNASPVTPTFQSANSPVENRRSNNARRISEPGPLRAAAQNNLGVIFESEDAMGPAIRAYGLAAYADPQVPLYHFNLGLALRKMGSFDRAAEELETVLRLAPQSTRARQRFAEIQSLLGHDAEALALTDAALQADRQSHGLWELKAQLLWKQHRLEEAREAALKAIELEPDCVVAHGYLGGVLQDQQRFDAAEAAYRKALELDPFFAPLYVNLGTVQHDRQQLWSAEQSFRKAIELWPDFALAYRNLGNVLADSREFAQATAALRKAIALDPDDVSAHRSLGNLSLKQHRLDEAEKHFRNALDVSPNDPESYYGLGDVQRERGQYAEAEQMYRKAIELKSDHANAHTGLGLVFHARRQFDEAEKFYRQAIELDPKESAPYHNLGEIYREVRGQPDKAEELYGKSIQLSPDRAGSYSGLGLVVLHRGNLAEAERLLRKARDLDPDSSSMNNNLGEVLRLRGQLDEAAQCYRKALELDPNNLSPYSNLGIIHAMRREFNEAEKMFRALLDRAPAKPSTYVNLACVCAEKGKLEEAEEFFRQALAMTPNRPEVCNSFASFLADHKLKLDEALTLSRRAVQAEPRNASNLDTLGWVHFQRGEFADAEATLRKAVSLFGQEAVAGDAWLHLGKVYETKGNRESALEAYRKALSLQSEHKEAKAALEQLEKEQRLK